MMSIVFVLIVLVLRLVLVALSIRYIIYNILIYMYIDIHIDILRYTLSPDERQAIRQHGAEASLA